MQRARANVEIVLLSRGTIVDPSIMLLIKSLSHEFGGFKYQGDSCIPPLFCVEVIEKTSPQIASLELRREETVH